MIAELISSINRLTRVYVFVFQSKILAQGSYQQLQSSGFDFVKLLGSSDETSVDSVPEANIANNGASPILSLRQCSNEKIKKPVEEEIGLGKSLERPDEEESEQHFLGENSSYVYVSYVSAADSTFRVLSMFFMCIVSQVLLTGTDYWITYW